MSQVSIIDIEGNHPQIPTRFNANVGFAIPIANVLEIYGDTRAAGSIPVGTVGSGNNITTYVQFSQAIAGTDATKVGLAAFNSSQFTVDSNGFVELVGGSSALDSIGVDDATFPGTNPVLPTAGLITVTGNQVAAGVIGAKVIRTNSLAASTYTIQVQQSGTSTTQNTNLNGVSHFNDNEFVVTNGFVSLRNTTVDQAQTIGAVTADITTIPLTTAGTYVFEIRVSAWESSGPAGKGFSINGVARSDGVTATLVSDTDGFSHCDASLDDADVNIINSGINIIVEVTGVAGLTINWGAVTFYVFRGA